MNAFLLALLAVLLVVLWRIFRSRRLAKQMERFWPGKVVAVTGARTGMGKACALLAARYGCHLVLTSRNADQLSDVVRECKANFPRDSQGRIALAPSIWMIPPTPRDSSTPLAASMF